MSRPLEQFRLVEPVHLRRRQRISRRTDRENAARLRVAEVQAHLRESRRHLDAGELQLALAAVAQALKLDDAHPEARALLAEVDASREHAVTEWIAEARDRVERGEATLVAELLDRINALDPGHPDVPTLTRDLRLVRADRSARNDSRSKRCTYPRGLTSQRHRDCRDRPVQRQGIGRRYRVNIEQRSRVQRR